MRSRLLLFGLAAWVLAGDSSAANHGTELWRMDASVGSYGHWKFLARGSVIIAGAHVPVVLLGESRADKPSGRYYDMKLIDGRNGRDVWEYDGGASSYVYAQAPDTSTRGPGWGHHAGAPELSDVNGDGSDDVVFLEEDSVWKTVLKAVQVTP